MRLNGNNIYSIFRVFGKSEILPLRDILAGKKTILFFYPKDDTPGCSLENKDFTEFQEDFTQRGYQIIGVSKDSNESHQKFVQKYNLKNDIISDPDLILHKELGAFGEKNNYGKIVQGVIRSTFIIDEQVRVRKQWKNVRAKGHALRVLQQL